MSILMPALRNVREQAKDSICMQRLQQWSVLFNMYSTENDGILMGWAEYNWFGGEFVEHAWIPMMYPYAKSFELYMCPSATELWSWGQSFNRPQSAWDFQYIVSGEPSAGEWYPYYKVGTEEYPIYSYGSYGKNEWITTPTEDCKESDYYKWVHFYLNIRFKNVARIPLLGDANWAAGFPWAEDEPAEFREHSPVCGCGGEINRWNLDRHRYSVNFAFLDWSVRKVGLRQLWSLKWSRQQTETKFPVPSWGNMNVVLDWNDSEVWPEWMQLSKNYEL
jgi:hypothetical protein